ncbi:MAG TPA: hypothetical protein VKZ57_02320 [Sphingobacterium sp.]|jgi:hypothetical protein|nr:hypothetical protein [Sphingobacterium sp.]
MKKFIYAACLLGLWGFAIPADAQVNVSINIGSQPLWGPVGYDYVRYYYIPEIDAYYDVSHRRYTYYQGNRWVTRASLPGRYRHVDMYRTYKVVVNHAHPWKNHVTIKRQYARYANNRSQRVLRDHRVYRSSDRYEKKQHKKYNQKKNKKYHKRDRNRR